MGVELSIIMVNWNGGELLRRAVESVVANPPSVEYDIVVVDNASADHSVALLRASELARGLSDSGRLRIIENAGNRGFGQANNQAFALTAAPFLLLLNPDTEVTPGSIDRLLATVRSNSRIAAAGPKLLNADGSLQISVWRNPPAAWEILLSQLYLYRVLPRRIRGELLLGGHWDHNRERRVPMLSGAAMLIRRQVIEDVGGFDEQFHMYGEDNEWCLRIVRGGWQLIFQPEAVILHLGAQSSLQRWSSLEKLRVQLEAGYFFQEHSLSRLSLITNQIANWLTASGQHFWRRLRGIDAPDVKLAWEIHWEHLKRALRFG
ncbi:MAG TPA: glycosyltransferase family 2 protein [Pyrinomonadaceae bacterium]|nr:glycosyltransferase family 2 protein [Pyrinomonadaceae bacterium]